MSAPTSATSLVPPRPASPRAPRTLRGAALAVAVLSAVTGTPRAAAGEEAIVCDLAWERGSLLDREGRRTGTFATRPEGVTDPPGLLAGRYGRVAVDGGRHLGFVLDVTPGRERVWFDTDLDGDFGPETPLDWTRHGLGLTASCTVKVPTRGGAPVPLEVRLQRDPFEDPTTLRGVVGGHRWGAASVDGRLVQVAVEDGNRNLAFDDEGVDRVLVDLDQNGEFDLGFGSPENVPLGTPFKLGARTFRVRAEDPLARRIAFVATRPESVAPGAGTADPLPRAGAEVPRETTTGFELEVAFTSARTAPEAMSILARIGRVGDPAECDFLAAVARSDRRRDVRAAAARALGNPRLVEHAASLASDLAGGADDAVAQAAVLALHAMDAPTRLDTFAAVALGPHESAVRTSARLLGDVDSAPARAALTKAMRHHTARHLRRAVFFGARTAAYGLPTPLLLDGASDEDGAIAAQSITDLFRIGHPRVRRLTLDALTRRSQPLVEAALPVLAAFDDAECVDALWTFANEPATESAALDLLAGMGDGANVTRLLRALDGGAPAEQRRACATLARIAAARIAPRLLDRLQAEPPPELREALVRALGRQGEVGVLDVLQGLAEDGLRTERQFAFRHIGSPVLSGHPKVDALLSKSLSSSDAALRALAIDAVRDSGARHLLERVVANLDHASRRVRRAAALCLGALPERSSVGPLVARLADESQPWVREAIGDALFRLTGQNLYDEPALWTQWYHDHRDTFVLPAVPPVRPGGGPVAEGGTFAPQKPLFYGIPLETESIVFVIDCSGSMQASASAEEGLDNATDTRLSRAARELIAAVEGLEDGARVNIVYFESAVRVWHKRMQVLDGSTRRELERFVRRQQPDGATNLCDALEAALTQKGAEEIVVLSDGEPTAGKFQDTSSILAQVADLNRRRQMRIHCVALGGTNTLLHRLTVMHDGEYVEK